jgi:hypothetical protein
MLNCRDVAERTSDYLDKCLPWQQRIGVWLHVLICRNCQRYLRQMRVLIGMLGRMPALVVTEETVERQVAVLKQGGDQC